MKAFILALLILTSSFTVAKEKLVIVTEEWPPYVIDSASGAAGLDYEVVEAVLRQMKYLPELKFVPWKRAVQMVEDGSAVAILDVSYSEERSKFIIFPDEYLSLSETVLFSAKNNSNTKFESFNDLKGKRIGTTSGYNYSDEFDGSKDFKKYPISSQESNFKKLLAGRIDFVASNKAVGLFMAKDMGILSELTFHKKPISGDAIYLGFSKANELSSQNLVSGFSDALKQFKSSDEYKKILSKYGQ